MAVVINGSGTVTGLAVGGLPDGIVDSGTLATNSVDSAELVDGAVDDSHMASISGRKNLIINGAMQVAQRGTSDTVDGGGWDYVIDRFCALGQTSAGVFTYSQDSEAPAGFNKSLKVAVTTADASLAAGDIYCIRHTIEGFNSAHLNYGSSDAKTTTLSFWVRSSLTGTFGGALNSEGNNRSYPFTYSISSANTWEKKSITISGDTTGTWGTGNSHGVRITWGLGVGSTYSGTTDSWAGSEYFSATSSTSVIGTNSSTWYITGVQLELGSTATEFEHRSYGEELALCQRYYHKTTSSNVGGAYQNIAVCTRIGNTVFRGIIEFPVTMRTQPSFSSTGSFQSLDGFTFSSVVVGDGASLDRHGIQVFTSENGSSGDSIIFRANNDATAALIYDAEL